MSLLKERVKEFAYRLGADLVGFGGVDRCVHAPLMMNPQGLMPSAKTVVVMAIHHPDAVIEQGGEVHPQIIGPYYLQYVMNARLDELSYRMATFLEDAGFDAIPIASSNIWRYNSYKDLNAIFAPDLSNIYMPVVAGLADMGFNGLALTPEFGARNRFVTVVTDAEIEADPLIPPGTICDDCMLCRRHCPTQALSKEIDGENVLKIEQYEYRFPKKNLWRCAWGEHFDLDLDLPIPEVVNESVILETAKKHGLRRGEMGQCLKFCVPKQRRYFDLKISKTPLRKKAITLDENLESRALIDRILSESMGKGVRYILVNDGDSLAGKGIDLHKELPEAVTAITLVSVIDPDRVGVRQDHLLKFGCDYVVDFACLDLSRKLEDLGFSSSVSCKWPNLITDAIIRQEEKLRGKVCIANTVLTQKRIRPHKRGFDGSVTRPTTSRKNATLADEIRDFTKSLGADLVGFSSSQRLDAITAQVRPFFEGEEILDAVDKSHKFEAWKPEISGRKRRLSVPEDYLPGAKSIIVFALRFHREVVDRATKPPAEAVGPYAFQTYETQWFGAVIGARLVGYLNERGFRAIPVSDLTGTGSYVASPRPSIMDAWSNGFAAFAAGLGSFTVNGRVATPEFGLRQRFIAVVTDAELRPDPIRGAIAHVCDGCGEKCVKACPMAAISSQVVEFSCEGVISRFNKIDAKLCDWSKRYALVGASGFKYEGSDLDIKPDGAITSQVLADALSRHDPIKKVRPVVVEECILRCP